MGRDHDVGEHSGRPKRYFNMPKSSANSLHGGPEIGSKINMVISQLSAVQHQISQEIHEFREYRRLVSNGQFVPQVGQQPSAVPQHDSMILGSSSQRHPDRVVVQSSSRTHRPLQKGNAASAGISPRIQKDKNKIFGKKSKALLVKRRDLCLEKVHASVCSSIGGQGW